MPFFSKASASFFSRGNRHANRSTQDMDVKKVAASSNITAEKEDEAAEKVGEMAEVFEGVVPEASPVISKGKETPLRSGGLSKDEKREYKNLKAKKGVNELSKHEKKRYKELKAMKKGIRQLDEDELDITAHQESFSPLAGGDVDWEVALAEAEAAVALAEFEADEEREDIEALEVEAAAAAAAEEEATAAAEAKATAAGVAATAMAAVAAVKAVENGNGGSDDGDTNDNYDEISQGRKIWTRHSNKIDDSDNEALERANEEDTLGVRVEEEGESAMEHQNPLQPMRRRSSEGGSGGRSLSISMMGANVRVLEWGELKAVSLPKYFLRATVEPGLLVEVESTSDDNSTLRAASLSWEVTNNAVTGLRRMLKFCPMGPRDVLLTDEAVNAFIPGLAKHLRVALDEAGSSSCNDITEDRVKGACLAHNAALCAGELFLRCGPESIDSEQAFDGDALETDAHVATPSPRRAVGTRQLSSPRASKMPPMPPKRRLLRLFRNGRRGYPGREQGAKQINQHQVNRQAQIAIAQSKPRGTATLGAHSMLLLVHALCDLCDRSRVPKPIREAASLSLQSGVKSLSAPHLLLFAPAATFRLVGSYVQRAALPSTPTKWGSDVISRRSVGLNGRHGRIGGRRNKNGGGRGSNERRRKSIERKSADVDAVAISVALRALERLEVLAVELKLRRWASDLDMVKLLQGLHAGLHAQKALRVQKDTKKCCRIVAASLGAALFSKQISMHMKLSGHDASALREAGQPNR